MSNSSNSKTRQVPLFILIAFPLLAMWFIYHTCHANNKESQYFNDLDLKLTGIITYIGDRTGYNGFGVIGVDILNSNKDYIDERSKRKYYYCLIHNNKAELYNPGIHDCDIGDTVRVDTKRKLYWLYKTNGEVLSFSLSLNDDDRYWRYISKYYQKI